MIKPSESERKQQLAYSELQYKTHDEQKRRRKAAKIVSVLRNFLGREDFAGLTVIDVGSSTGTRSTAWLTPEPPSSDWILMYLDW